MPVRPYLGTAYLSTVLLFSACSTGPDRNNKIDESPQGSVSLKRIPDPSFQAAHPIKIDSSTLALVLNGVLVRDKRSVQKNPSAFSDARRLFSGSEVGHLAPLISEALRRAASDQQVEFRVGQGAGALYAYGRSLYVTLNQYHPGTDATTTNTSDPNGSSNWTLSFVPEAAKRPDSYVDAASTESTLVLDYELLAKLPPAPVPTASPQPEPALSLPSPNAEKADPAKKDSEIEALRKELQEIKKQLAEQQAERARSQPQKPAP